MPPTRPVSDIDLLVLLAVGRTTAECDLARALPRVATHEALAAMHAELLIERDPTGSPIKLTPKGQAHLSNLLHKFNEACEPRPHSVLNQFNSLNTDIKRHIAGLRLPLESLSWNDVVLLRRHQVAGAALLAAISGWGDRYENYRLRLNSACNLVERGQLAFLADPRVASYHNSWFELHQDLLITTGTTRDESAES